MLQILEVVGEGDSVKYAHYDGWVSGVDAVMRRACACVGACLC